MRIGQRRQPWHRYEVVRQLAELGHTVILGARNPKKGQAAAQALATHADQEESVRLCRHLERDHPECAGFLRYAESHREVIRRFGRFALLNGVLNRASTPDEIVYLCEHSGY
jgi:NAD(P)-dependent dehydrogenase (short-subunit alcohol dehydrogenase family)